MRNIILAATAAAALMAGPAAAAITTFTDATAFETAVGPTTLFDFNGTADGSFDGTSYDVGPFTLTGESTGTYINKNEVSGGQVSANACGVAICGSIFAYSIIFDAPIFAFGATFVSAHSASGINFAAGGETFAGPVASDGFFGFSRPTAFSSIVVSAANEVHHFDDVRFASAAVPEPATWAMMILGFGLAGAAVRRRNAAAA